MSVLESTLDRKSERFAQNRAEMLETLAQLDALHDEVAAGGGDDAMKRLRARGIYVWWRSASMASMLCALRWVLERSSLGGRS